MSAQDFGRMSRLDADAPVGAVIDDKFRVKSEIGRGGMATVYAAENVDIGKPVAVKVLAAEYATSKTVTERFLREARAAAKIKSPYICEVYDVGTYQDRPFIVMELLKGESLYERLARERRLKFDDALRIATQVAEGLKKAHENNVVHRDLKPENIFLTTNSEGAPLSKVVDFGLAKFYEPHQDAKNARLTKEGALFGTPAYMSPEQARAKGNVDGRSDLWALGCIVYEMLTGRTVWDVEQGVAMILAQIANSQLPDARRYRKDLPLAFDAWFKKALARKVEQRFASAAEFITGLEQALTRLPTDPPLQEIPEVPMSAPGQSATDDTEPVPEVEATDGAHPGGDFTPPQEPDSEAPSTTIAAGKESKSKWPGVILAVGAAIVLLGGGVWIVRGGPGAGGAPAEDTPDALVVAEGQNLLRDEHPKDALEKFQAAFDMGQSKAARSLLAHSSVALDDVTGACRIRGIGHPRPFAAATASSKPFLQETAAGLFVTWADSESAADKVQGRVTRLDSALRRVAPVVPVTPEAEHAREPELFVYGDKLGLHYWDFDGEAAGAYVRPLDEHGNIAGSPQLISTQIAGHPYYPAVAADAEGNVWVVWVEPTRPRVHDLFVRKLDSSLKPLTPPTAVTGYATPKRGKTQADRPSLQIVGEMLFVTYTLRRPSSQHVLLLRIPIKGAENGKGVEPIQTAEAPGDEESDRFLGQAKQLSTGKGKHSRSTLRCGSPGCFVTWDEIPGGAFLAYLNADGSVQWRRSISPSGARPGIGLGSEGGLLSWYDNKLKRVKVAPFSPEAMGDPSVIGRINAVMNHPQPQVIPVRPGILSAGSETGWYIAWRAYEAAVQEPFIARAGCQ